MWINAIATMSSKVKGELSQRDTKSTLLTKKSGGNDQCAKAKTLL